LLECKAGEVKSVNIAFTHEFRKAPLVLAAIMSVPTTSDYGTLAASAGNITTKGFVLSLANAGQSGRNPRIGWQVFPTL
jgi:hypothetical protein